MGDTTEPARAAASADGGLDQDVADDAQADDPWFAPGPKTADSGTGDSGTGDSGTGDSGTGASSSAGADGQAHETDWFLRTGRAGLHPDTETSWEDAAGDTPADHHQIRVTAAGAPPWAGETTAVSAATPPPWETGPWPGPGGLRSVGRSGDAQAAAAALDAAAAGWDGGAANGGAANGGAANVGAANVVAAPDGPGTWAGPTRWPARTVVVAGLIPLVVPGLVLGFLSRRQAGSAAVRKASWVAIGASLAWAVIIVVIVATVSGGSAANCNGYPAAVHQAYQKALSDLSGSAPASVQEADFDQAASLANASAAAAGQIGVRTALFTMANDMAQARADVVAARPISATLRQHLAGDGQPPAGSCAS